ncbi:MAG TPA: YtxH domain-containing protein [Clostridium sp.]|uniref:YtxH domain-containing protein n=1 Tax=Clostridium sp. TaxID=1506 RepID=UPI002F948337
MLLVTNVVKAINKEKRNERAKDLALAAVLGAAAGAVTALFIAPKSEEINVSLDTLKEKVVETVEKGKEKVDELVKEGKDKFGVGKDKLESVRSDIMHRKDSVLDTTETIIDDLKG